VTDTPPPADPASPESAPTREPFRRQQRDDGSPSDRIRPPELPGEAPPETDSLRFPLLALALTSMIVSLLLAWMQADPSVPVAPRQPSAQERLQMPQWIDIPGGRLQQRDPPARFEVAPFRISRTEITVEQFRLFIKYTGYSNPAWTDFPCTGTSTDLSWDRPGYEQADTFPVVCVSARDAMAFAGWLSEQIGQPLRLPTELEWEYAARAGTATRFWWGDEYQERYAECFGCGPRPPQHPTYVGALAPNPFGLLDISGMSANGPAPRLRPEVPAASAVARRILTRPPTWCCAAGHGRSRSKRWSWCTAARLAPGTATSGPASGWWPRRNRADRRGCRRRLDWHRDDSLNRALYSR